MITILSYGLGVESSAILVEWIENPDSRAVDADREHAGVSAPRFAPDSRRGEQVTTDAWPKRLMDVGD